MFGFFEREVKVKKSPEDMRFEMDMALYDAREALFEKAISCRHCNDLGVAVVALRRIDSPETVEIEYMKCDCGKEPHQKLASLVMR